MILSFNGVHMPRLHMQRPRPHSLSLFLRMGDPYQSFDVGVMRFDSIDQFFLHKRTRLSIQRRRGFYKPPSAQSLRRTERGNIPSNNRISAVPNPTATLSAILCDSPPLKLAQSLSQSSGSIPHDSAISRGRSGFGGAFLPLRALNLRTVARNARGLEGRREGRWGT